MGGKGRGRLLRAGDPIVDKVKVRGWELEKGFAKRGWVKDGVDSSFLYRFGSFFSRYPSFFFFFFSPPPFPDSVV